MLNLPRFATRVAVTALAGALSACSAITFGIANAPAAFGPFERKADLASGTDPRHEMDVYVPKGVLEGTDVSSSVRDAGDANAAPEGRSADDAALDSLP